MGVEKVGCKTVLWAHLAKCIYICDIETREFSVNTSTGNQWKALILGNKNSASHLFEAELFETEIFLFLRGKFCVLNQLFKSSVLKVHSYLLVDLIISLFFEVYLF